MGQVNASTCVAIGHYDLDKPAANDDVAMWILATEAGLDSDSSRVNQLFCRELADTSVVARTQGELVGFAGGYRLPTSPDVLFVWKVAVSKAHRQQGVGRAMLLQLRRRLHSRGVWWMEASVPAESHCSRRLFQSFALAAGARYAELQPSGATSPTPGDTELLLRVGTNSPEELPGAVVAAGRDSDEAQPLLR
jgi:L-2,4-diaminobutyric acid acetyltransferase